MTRRPPAPSTASPFLEFDLAPEVDRLRRQPTWATGRSARTLMDYDDLRVVLTVLRAHARISEQETAGRISIHLVSGHIRLTASGRAFDLRPGSLIGLNEGSTHHMEALEESVFLATTAWPGP